MENKVFVTAVLLLSVFGVVLGDVCYDGDLTLYCSYDCCGDYGYVYCCSYNSFEASTTVNEKENVPLFYKSTGGIAASTTVNEKENVPLFYKSTGGIAGITIGCIVFTVFWVVVILLCRRRRIYGTYWGRPAGTMTVMNQNQVATVSSTNTFAAQPPPYGNQYGNQVRY